MEYASCLMPHTYIYMHIISQFTTVVPTVDVNVDTQTRDQYNELRTSLLQQLKPILKAYNNKVLCVLFVLYSTSFTKQFVHIWVSCRLVP